MGRPKTYKLILPEYRKRWIMTDSEQQAFVEYFDWKSNREMKKGIVKEKSVKAISSSVGRHSNKFLFNKWVNKSKGWTVYKSKRSYKNQKTGKTIERESTKKQKVPIYKSNFNFIFPYLNARKRDSKAWLIEDNSKSVINLFFELEEIRKNISRSFESNHILDYSLYDLTLMYLENDLIHNWLLFNGTIKNELYRFYGKVFLNTLNSPEGCSLIKDIQRYLKDIKGDYGLLNDRIEIIKKFDKFWNKNKENKNLQVMIKSMAQRTTNQKDIKKSDLKECENEIKIIFWTFLLYNKSVLKNISESILSPLILELINK
jgi:hypothetical protein